LKTWHRLLLATLALILAALYVCGAADHLRFKNTRIESHNQSAYVRYARRLAESGWSYHGDGNRMPLYPAIQALAYREDMPEETLFERGKWVNLALSLALLAGLAIWLWRRFPGWHAVNLTLVLAFTVFAVKASYFQPELLFYTMNLGCFVLMWKLLQRPRWPRALATGALLALTYLTKASVTPALALWVAAMVAQATARWYRARRAPREAETPSSATAGAPPSLAASLLSAALVVATFLAVLSPYLIANKRIYGHYFYNVNSTFYMWYDTWEEAKAGTGAHGDREGWPQMPADQIPSLQKYVREHTPAQLAGRVWKGLVTLEEYTRHSLGYFKYAWIYLGLAARGAILARKRLGGLIRAHAGQIAYAAMYFPAHAILYAWYEPIGHGDRFILAQFLPWVFVLSAALWATVRERRVTLWGVNLSLIDAANILLLPLVAYDIYLTLAVRIYTRSGGN